MPTTDEVDHHEESFRNAESRRRTIFKVIEIILWLIVTIIVVTACISFTVLAGYFQ